MITTKFGWQSIFTCTCCDFWSLSYDNHDFDYDKDNDNDYVCLWYLSWNTADKYKIMKLNVSWVGQSTNDDYNKVLVTINFQMHLPWLSFQWLSSFQASH